jgi:hypothetical protein
MAEAGHEPVRVVDVRPAEVDLSRQPVIVHLRLRIADGLHVLTPTAGVAGIESLSLSLRHAPGLSIHLRWPTGKAMHLDLAGQVREVYGGDVELEVEFRGQLEPSPGAGPTLVLRYQACGPTYCLAPGQAEIPVRFV